MDNHLDRPEVRIAREGQVGVVERYSTTVQADMLYAAVPARHPEIAYVRVALPLTTVTRQVTRIGAAAALAFALAAPVAIVPGVAVFVRCSAVACKQSPAARAIRRGRLRRAQP